MCELAAILAATRPFSACTCYFVASLPLSVELPRLHDAVGCIGVRQLAINERLQEVENMQKRCVFAPLFWLAIVAQGAWAKDFPPGCESALQRIVDDYMSRSESIGISVGVTLDDSVRFYNAGLLGKSNPIMPDEHSSFEIGSVSKTLTGMLLAEAVVEERLSLEDDIRKHLPEKYPNLEYEGTPVKVAHLLNHSSGLPFQLPHRLEDFQDLTPARSSKLRELQDRYGRRDLLHDLHEVSLSGKPGVNLSYSNTAAQVLGVILEDANNRPFETLLADFAKAHDMNETRCSLDLVEDSAAVGYNGQGEEMPTSSPTLGPAGAMCSTAADLVSFAKLQLNEDDPIVALSHRPTWGDIQYYAIGLNWQMERRENQPYRIWQSGGTGGFTSLIQIYPSDRLGLVILTNESDEKSQETLSKMAFEFHKACTKPSDRE